MQHSRPPRHGRPSRNEHFPSTDPAAQRPPWQAGTGRLRALPRAAGGQRADSGRGGWRPRPHGGSLLPSVLRRAAPPLLRGKGAGEGTAAGGSGWRARGQGWGLAAERAGLRRGRAGGPGGGGAACGHGREREGENGGAGRRFGAAAGLVVWKFNPGTEMGVPSRGAAPGSVLLPGVG